MNTKELRESIIQKIRQTNDEELLNYFNQILSNKEVQKDYILSEFEKKMLEESQADYRSGQIISNDDVVSRNDEWLKE